MWYFLLIDLSHNALIQYSTMHHFVTEMCTFVHISVQTGALWDFCLVDYGICEMGLFTWQHRVSGHCQEHTICASLSHSLEAARFVFRIIRPLWNLTGISTALLPKCMPNFEAMWWFKLPISRLRDFMRFYDKTSYRILKRGPGVQDSSLSNGCRATHAPLVH